MKFEEFKHRLSKLKNKSLPGIESHIQLAPTNRIELIKKIKTNNKMQDASVSLCFFSDSKNDVRMPLILRNEYDGVHSNQISFPGGKKENNDADLIETAIRETNEEIGIKKDNMIFQLKLTDIYIPPSNFLVRPYIFTLKNEPLIKQDNIEVIKVLAPTLSSLIGLKIHYGFTDKQKIKNPYFIIENHIVWGATAMILNEFISIIKS